MLARPRSDFLPISQEAACRSRRRARPDRPFDLRGREELLAYVLENAQRRRGDTLASARSRNRSKWSSARSPKGLCAGPAERRGQKDPPPNPDPDCAGRAGDVKTCRRRNGTQAGAPKRRTPKSKPRSSRLQRTGRAAALYRVGAGQPQTVPFRPSGSELPRQVKAIYGRRQILPLVAVGEY